MLHARTFASVNAHIDACDAVLVRLHTTAERLLNAGRLAYAAHTKALDDAVALYGANAELLRAAARVCLQGNADQVSMALRLLDDDARLDAAPLVMLVPIPRSELLDVSRLGAVACYTLDVSSCNVSVFDSWTARLPSRISIDTAIDAARCAEGISASDIRIACECAESNAPVCVDALHVHGEFGRFTATFQLPVTPSSVRVRVLVTDVVLREWTAQRVGFVGSLERELHGEFPGGATHISTAIDGFNVVVSSTRRTPRLFTLGSNFTSLIPQHVSFRYNLPNTRCMFSMNDDLLVRCNWPNCLQKYRTSGEYLYPCCATPYSHFKVLDGTRLLGWRQDTLSQFGVFTVPNWKSFYDKDRDPVYMPLDGAFGFNRLLGVSMLDADHAVCVLSKRARTLGFTAGTQEVALFRLNSETRDAWYLRTLFPYENDGFCEIAVIAKQVLLLNSMTRTLNMFCVETGELLHTLALTCRPIGMEWRCGRLLVYGCVPDGVSDAFTISVYT